MEKKLQMGMAIDRFKPNKQVTTSESLIRRFRPLVFSIMNNDKRNISKKIVLTTYSRTWSSDIIMKEFQKGIFYFIRDMIKCFKKCSASIVLKLKIAIITIFFRIQMPRLEKFFKEGREIICSEIDFIFPIINKKILILEQTYSARN